MRYLDTGSRNPAHALGAWLGSEVLGGHGIAALRWQSGFFGAEALGYFVPLLGRLAAADRPVKLLVGSNDGTTTRADVEALLAATGPPRRGLMVGIVKFDNAYFHPKTIHINRNDGSQAAYVGSANVTPSGTTSLHVEAGLVLDTRENDDRQVLNEVSRAIDWWFDAPREGLYVVKGSADLDVLVRDGILNMPRAVLVPRPTAGSRSPGQGPKLSALVQVPKLGLKLTVKDAPAAVAAPPVAPQIVPAGARGSLGRGRPEQWDKKLTVSDAQRKPTGNQRGSITLVQGGHSINAQRYFRHELFASAPWLAGTTRTGEPIQIARVPFSVQFLGKNLGTMELEVTYAPNREANQANYTSLLHLGPLAPHFMHSDVTGRKVELARTATGGFILSIS